MKIKKTVRIVLAVIFAFAVTAKGVDLIPDLDVPYEPTHPQVVNTMLSLAEVSEDDILYDLGCGDGRIVISAITDFNAKRGVGIDIDPRRIREANERAKGYGVQDRVEFIEADIMDSDISDATVVAIYLLNSVNFMIRPKLFNDLEPGTRVVSHAFHMTEWKEDRKVYHERARNKSIYYWVIPAHLGGVWRWEAEGTEVQMDLTQKFQEVSGSLIYNSGSIFDIKNAEVNGKQFSFKTEEEHGGKIVKVEYEGRVEGDKIKGTRTQAGKRGSRSREWTAERKPADLYGRWRITFDGDKSSYNGILDINRNDSGIIASFMMDERADINLIKQAYVWGGSIYLQLPLSGSDDKLIISGNLQEKTGAGTMHNEMWDPMEYKWTGERLK